MSERRHCDQQGCEKSEPADCTGDRSWFYRLVSGKDTYHFCSRWCLATWAVAQAARFESERGPIVEHIVRATREADREIRAFRSFGTPGPNPYDVVCGVGGTGSGQ